MEPGKSNRPNVGDVPTTSPSDEPGIEGAGVGSVGMRLDLVPGTTLTSIQWIIANAANSYTGTVSIGDAQSVEFVAGGILAGSGYTVTITASDSQGDPCTGSSAPFSVNAGSVTQTVLAVACRASPDGSFAADVNTGTVEVDASVSLVATETRCPGISSFSIAPRKSI